MIKCFKHILIEISLIILCLFLAYGYFSYAVKYRELRSERQNFTQVIPSETVFVEINKPIVKVKKEFISKVDTVYKYDTLYAFGSGITWKAGIEREFLDIFKIIDTVKFSHLDENAGLFGVEGLIYQIQPLPVVVDIRLRDNGVWYSWGTLKTWQGRLKIDATYYDERSPFKFYIGGGVLMGRGVYGGINVLYREKYLGNLWFTNKGDVGLGFQIKFK